MIAVYVMSGAGFGWVVTLLIRDAMKLRRASRAYKERREQLYQDLAEQNQAAESMRKSEQILKQSLLASSNGIPSSALKNHPLLPIIDKILTGARTDTNFPATTKIRIEVQDVRRSGTKGAKYSIKRRFNKAGVPVAILAENDVVLACEGRETFSIEADGKIVCLVGPLRNSLFNKGYGNN